jgi:glutathione synthase/RimK-type ligase-like ATP-grasp enzyme
MLVGIYINPGGTLGRAIKNYDDIFRKILDHNLIEHITLDASDPLFWKQVARLDLFIFHWSQIDDHHQLAKTIIPIVEKTMGIKCFPDMATCWHYDNKIREYYLLRHYGFPFIHSWIFWDKQSALKWLEHAELPVVFKLKGGAGSSNVVLIKTKPQAEKLIKRMFGKGIFSGQIPVRDNIAMKYFNLYQTMHRWGGNVLRKLRGEDISPDWQKHKNYVLFQKYMPNNKWDTRVTIIGDKAFAFRRFTRTDDFRASGSGVYDLDITQIDTRFIESAFNISRTLEFQSMAYDYIYDDNNAPALIEISYTFPDNTAYSTGYWDIDLVWHPGRYCTQYFQLMHALDIPDLRLPVLENS